MSWNLMLQTYSRPASLVSYANDVIQWNDVKVKATNKYTTLVEQISFVEEEFDELLLALKEKDRVETVDAIIDLFVVSSYYYYLRYDGITTKESKEVFNRLLHNKNCQPSLVCLEDYITTRNAENLLSQVVALCYSVDYAMDYNICQVLSSNWSKYPTIEELTDACEDYKKLESTPFLLREKEVSRIEKDSKGRYTGVSSILVDDHNLVFLDRKNKIMKPLTFRPPELIVVDY